MYGVQDWDILNKTISSATPSPLGPVNFSLEARQLAILNRGPDAVHLHRMKKKGTEASTTFMTIDPGSFPIVIDLVRDAHEAGFAVDGGNSAVVQAYVVKEQAR